MANRGVINFLMAVGMLIFTFITVRVIIPGLVNAQNDGALILAIITGVGLIVGWIYFLSFFIKFLKGDYR